MKYITEDKVTKTSDYSLSGIWPLEEAAKICITIPNSLLYPDVSGKWLVIFIEEVLY